MIVVKSIYEAVKILNCIFEIFLLYSCMELVFPVYEKREKIKFIESIICAFFVFGINSIGNPYLNLIGVPMAFVLFTGLVFRINVRLNILYSLFYYAILAVIEFVFHQVYHLLGIDISALDFRWIFRLVAEKIFCFMIIQIIKKKQRVSLEMEYCSILSILFIFPVSSFVLLNGFLLMDQYWIGYFLICLGGVLLVFSNVVNFSVVDKLLAAEKLAKDSELLALKTNLEHSHYRQMEEINHEYAGYVHEMRHIVQAIKQFAEMENTGALKKLSLEASALLTEERTFVKKVYINDPIVNAMIFEREKKAENQGIKFEADVQPGVSLDFVSETDKIRIIGNILDNALDAASLCEKGYVSVSIYVGNEEIVILRVINNFAHKNEKNGNQFLSTKKDGKRHGFGLQMVEELSVKYNGMFNIKEENGKFVAMLILSKVQKTEK